MQPVSDQQDKTKKKKFRKMKQLITEKLQNIKDEEISDSEQVDLSIELHPIKHYVNDKAEMIEQMFTSLGPTLIQNMLPPLLKPVPLNELKADCLIQLLGMSKKRIFTSIDGKELQSSSESEFDSEDSSDSGKKSVKSHGKVQLESKAAKRKYIIDADTLNVSIDNEDDLENFSLSDEETSKSSRKRKSLEKLKKPKPKQPKLGLNGSAGVEGASPISLSSNEESEIEEVVPSAPKKGQTLLEILELEMRAKAIRSLLKQGTSSSSQPGKDSEAGSSLLDPNIRIKPEPKEPEPDPDIIEIIEPPPPQPIVLDSDDEDENPGTENPGADKPAAAPETDKPAAAPGIDKPAAAPGTDKPAASPAADDLGKSDPKAQGSSWSERYLDNKETEKLIKTSKMCTNIRKRMRLVRTMQQMQQVKEKVDRPVVIGSISEYQQLVGSESSSSLTKSTSESELAEAVAPEAQSSPGPEVPVASATSRSPSSNLDKTDLVCSDILEIDVTIADLDTDISSKNVSLSRRKVTNSYEVRKPAVIDRNKLRTRVVSQSDDESRTEKDKISQSEGEVALDDTGKGQNVTVDSIESEQDKILSHQNENQNVEGRKEAEPQKVEERGSCENQSVVEGEQDKNCNSERVDQVSDENDGEKGKVESVVDRRRDETENEESGEPVSQNKDGSVGEVDQPKNVEEEEQNQTDGKKVTEVSAAANVEAGEVEQNGSGGSAVVGSSEKEDASGGGGDEKEEGEITCPADEDKEEGEIDANDTEEIINVKKPTFPAKKRKRRRTELQELTAKASQESDEIIIID